MKKISKKDVFAACKRVMENDEVNKKFELTALHKFTEWSRGFNFCFNRNDFLREYMFTFVIKNNTIDVYGLSQYIDYNYGKGIVKIDLKEYDNPNDVANEFMAQLKSWLNRITEIDMNIKHRNIQNWLLRIKGDFSDVESAYKHISNETIFSVEDIRKICNEVV